jgi:Ni/Fe-hydrogenase 1 B-type cytochrome subunit
MAAAVQSPQAPQAVYVWDIPVRLTHWVNVIAFFVLCVTGFYIGEPFMRGSVFLMGWMLSIHMLSGYILLASVLFRSYWAFFGGGGPWKSWKVFFPYMSAEGWRGMKDTFLYYTFLRRETPKETGHNPLAGLAYSAVWTLFLTQIVTGFALYSIVQGGGWAGTLFGWVFLIVSPQTTHLVHHMIMWLLLGFFVHHVYSAVLMDIEERNGILTSIFTGYKFIRRPQ